MHKVAKVTKAPKVTKVNSGSFWAVPNSDDAPDCAFSLAAGWGHPACRSGTAAGEESSTCQGRDGRGFLAKASRAMSRGALGMMNKGVHGGIVLVKPHGILVAVIPLVLAHRL